MSSRPSFTGYHHNPRSAQAILKHARNVIAKHYASEIPSQREELVAELTALAGEDQRRQLFYARPLSEALPKTVSSPGAEAVAAGYIIKAQALLRDVYKKLGFWNTTGYHGVRSTVVDEVRESIADFMLRGD